MRRRTTGTRPTVPSSTLVIRPRKTWIICGRGRLGRGDHGDAVVAGRAAHRRHERRLEDHQRRAAAEGRQQLERRDPRRAAQHALGVVVAAPARAGWPARWPSRRRGRGSCSCRRPASAAARRPPRWSPGRTRPGSSASWSASSRMQPVHRRGVRDGVVHVVEHAAQVARRARRAGRRGCRRARGASTTRRSRPRAPAALSSTSKTCVSRPSASRRDDELRVQDPLGRAAAAARARPAASRRGTARRR